MSVKVSVLGPLEPLDVASFEQTESAVHAGDGILLTHRRHRATFLPSVWEQVPDADTVSGHALAEGRLAAAGVAPNARGGSLPHARIRGLNLEVSAEGLDSARSACSSSCRA